jgi:hypothetical protein
MERAVSAWAALQDLPAVPGGHHPRHPVEHRTEVVGPASSASPVAMPIRTGNSLAIQSLRFEILVGQVIS